MKKILFITALSTIVLLAFSACKDDSSVKGNSDTNSLTNSDESLSTKELKGIDECSSILGDHVDEFDIAWTALNNGKLEIHQLEGTTKREELIQFMEDNDFDMSIIMLGNPVEACTPT